MAQKQGRLRARRTLREGKQCYGAGVKDVIFGSGHHEAVSSGGGALLEIADAVLVAMSARCGLHCIFLSVDRNPLAESNVVVAPTARRTLEKALIPVAQETRNAEGSPSAAAMPLRRWRTAFLSSRFSSSARWHKALMAGKAEKNSALTNRIFSRSPPFTGSTASTFL